MDSDSKFPQSFICPLTQEVMRDPVMDPEGNSYERTAIEEWLNKNSTSPITRNALTKTQLLPNRALKDAIEEKRKELGLPPLVPAALPATPSTAAASSSSPSSSSSSTVSLSAVARKDPRDSSDKNIHDVLVSIKTIDGTVRTPVDCVCVIDVSGSMSTEATLKSAEGTVEAFGLSLLDIVKHAMKTLISALGPQDRLGLVTYSSKATTVFPLTEVANQDAKKMMISAVEALNASGSTNLWDGLHQGLEMVKKVKDFGRLASVLLLTDGLPTISPPRGEVQMLKRYKDQNQDISCSINTFGFGYDINSVLLRDVAIEGGGMYSFIPDSSFVGTTFVHTTSNLLTTLAKNVNLSLEPLNGASIVWDGLLGGHISEITSWGASYSLPSLQLGQSKDVVVRLSLPSSLGDKPFIAATLKYELRDSEKPVELSVTSNSKNGGLEVEVQRHRLVFVDTVRKGMESQPTARALVQALIKEVEESASQKEAPVVALVKDLRGQVTEAFSRGDWFKKWGTHYLPSLMRAHLLQQCNNFKDPGVQHFGGTLFRTIRDQVDDLFLQLPPPTPSIRHASSSASKPTRSVNMKSYHSSSRVCFAGSSQVTLIDGTLKRVDQLRKGDLVQTPGVNSTSAEIVCVLTTISRNGQAELVELPGGLLVTPYHPIRLEDTGKWIFPCELSPAVSRSCDAVYSFVLSEGHVMLINGVQCVALGHGLFDDEVVSHPYFGTQRVIDDLKRMPGWNNGRVELLSGCVVKDEHTGLVCGLIHPSEIRSGCGVEVLEEVKVTFVQRQLVEC